MSGHWDESNLKRRIKELGAKNKRLAECEEVASRFNADLKAENKRLHEQLDTISGNRGYYTPWEKT